MNRPNQDKAFFYALAVIIASSALIAQAAVWISGATV